MDARQPKFLAPDSVYLLSNDSLDFSQRPKSQRRQRIDTGHQLPDIAGSNEELVAHRFRVCGIVSKRRNESARPAHWLSPHD
jgi:hypothetical protein